MLKIAALTGALAIGLMGGAYAQTTGPAGQGSTAQQSGNTGANSGTSATTRPDGTTGMSSGGGSGMTDKGGANGNPSGMPKTTTGPQGPASNTESPPK